MAHAAAQPALVRFVVRFLLPAWIVGMAVPAWAENVRRWPKLEEVIVVSKTHFDIGFTDLASRVVDRYRTSMADQALKLVDESRNLAPDMQFSWTLAGWPMSQVLWPGQTAERRERFVAAMRAGRLVPHALAFTTHTESLDLEDLTRGFRFSVEMARLAGQPLPTGCKMTDVPDHTRGLATVLANAGVKFFHHGCNDNCTPADLPELYWWEGPDGSRVLTALSRTYGSDLCPPAGWPYNTWLCMWMTYDNQGPPNTGAVEALFARAKRDLPGVRVRFGRLSDFADAIAREKPDLPVVRGDTPDTWIYGIGSMPIETQLAHATRPRIAALESLDTLLRTWGVPTPPAAAVVRDAYENTLLFGEHTWGPDVARYAGYSYGDEWKKKLAAGEYRFLLEGFDQKRAYAHRAAELVEPAIQKRMAALAKAVAVPGRRIVVFNPLPWTRDGEVEVPWDQALPSFSVADPANGEHVAAAVKNGRLRFIARTLPPLGYRTYVPGSLITPDHDLASNDNAQRIENKFFCVTLDPARCGIKSIVDKRTGRELVNTRSPYALGQYLYERFDADQGLRHAHDYVTFRPKQEQGEIDAQSKPHLPSAKEHPYCVATASDATLEISRSVVSVTALLKSKPHGTIRDATQLRITLYCNCLWLDLEWSIANKTPDPWPEGGWLCFPLCADNPTFRLARLGSIVDPAKDLVRSSNHDLFCLNGGLTVEGADGVRTGICPIDAQLVSPERPGLWLYSRDFVAHKPDVFVALFNNLYSTNFAQWIEGSWSSRVRLWAIDRRESTPSSLIGNSWEARVACLAAAADGAAGKLPQQATGVVVEKLPSPGAPSTAERSAASLSSRGPLVTAFGANPYGEGTLLQFWEQMGDGGAFTVHLPGAMGAATAQPCDLRGQPTGAPVTVSRQGAFIATIRPMAPASFILLAPTRESQWSKGNRFYNKTSQLLTQ
ncbi:MAG: hypothetical protein ACLP9L_15425 [Thermoguttaceae bacterium]